MEINININMKIDIKNQSRKIRVNEADERDEKWREEQMR